MLALDERTTKTKKEATRPRCWPFHRGLKQHSGSTVIAWMDVEKEASGWVGGFGAVKTGFGGAAGLMLALDERTSKTKKEASRRRCCPFHRGLKQHGGATVTAWMDANKEASGWVVLGWLD
ncbi:hypothetical protein LWI28_019965 [Acer negundo]|uniref:Uncharacterized protein n=1 Tax=Acer negundo TaxID=4023 RepID=A0AAD5IG22_ACENE|nr:hypothetical protein LWI28_019965 [Acer negundo]